MLDPRAVYTLYTPLATRTSTPRYRSISPQHSYKRSSVRRTLRWTPYLEGALFLTLLLRPPCRLLLRIPPLHCPRRTGIKDGGDDDIDDREDDLFDECVPTRELAAMTLDGETGSSSGGSKPTAKGGKKKATTAAAAAAPVGLAARVKQRFGDTAAPAPKPAVSSPPPCSL